MYIRESKTKNKKTGKVYVKHSLVESVWTEKGPRQRLVLTLGKLTLDRSLWKELALALEAYLNGDKELEYLSFYELPQELLEEITRQRAVITHHQKRKIDHKGSENTVEGADIQEVDINSIAVTESRSLGAELVANDTWQQLGFSEILTDCGFSEKEVALSAAVIWGRLIEPGSDLATWRWLRESSSLPDFFDANISKVHKDRVYEIADKLLLNKDKLEAALYQRQCEIFDYQQTLFLFDLTNFYFEGKGELNKLAKRGKSKEKRSQNVLVSLALVVDEHGFPVRSEVFEGNVSEPSTLKGILETCGLLDNPRGELPFKPVLVMDRGIATKENVAFIRQHNFPFTMIERADKTSEFRDHFESMKGFEPIEDAKGQIIHLKKIEKKVLCVSESRVEKEKAIHDKKVERSQKDLDALAKAITSGRLKDSSKIQQRIGRIKERHSGFDKLFEVVFSEEPLELTYKLKPDTDFYVGAYVIEHDGVEGSAEEIWRIYTTLSKVENSFRCMKSDLGTRPVFHHGAERTKAHLFLSILAFHMLANIEHRLIEAGSPARWFKVREILNTHRRSTIQWKDAKNQTWHKKLSSRPEVTHLDIYRKLNIRNPLKDQIIRPENEKPST